MENTSQDALLEAIERNSGAVLSLPSAGMLRHHKTRFLSQGEGGFWVESIADEHMLLDNLIVSQTPIGIAFKIATTKVIFATPIWRRQPGYRMNAQLEVEALLLAFPEQVKTVQRRAAYRVHIPSSCGLVLRVWKIPEHAVVRDRPSSTLEVVAAVRDLSVGGMSLLCPPQDGEVIRLVADQRLRVALSFEEHEALVEGRVKHVRPNPDKSARVGVQFKKLEENLDGRQTLSKLTAIVGQLQREEVRRVRLGMTG